MKKQYYYKEIGCDDFNGPYPSMAKTEKAIIDEHKELWESSCNCTQREPETRWANPVQIFQLVKTVELKITAKIEFV